MKNYMYVIALLSISFMSTDIYSQFKFEKPSIPGLTGDKEETESSGNPADAAAKLEKLGYYKNYEPDDYKRHILMRRQRSI